MTQARVSNVLGELLSGLARELTRGSGPVKWCRICGRKHARRAPCHLITVDAKAKSGQTVKRRVRP